jgi:hypothetical protein
MNLNGIFLLVIGLSLVIFRKPLATLFDKNAPTFWNVFGQIVIVLMGIFLITGGILFLIGVTKVRS